jgi:CDP-diacylglycerol--serine O-phosphatidyltransferase
MKKLPHILTLANLFCGALAIVFILQAPQFLSSYNGTSYLVTAPPPLWWGSVLIAAGAVFDFFDGLAARALRASSELGKQLDSLADVVTFGVAPGMILYQLLRDAYMRQPGAMEVTLLAVLPALLLPCFAAWRLGKFNLDERQRTMFRGVPTPAVGLLVASFPLLMLQGSPAFYGWLEQLWVLYVVIALLCVLMVCNVPFFSLKIKKFGWRDAGLRYVLIVLTAVSIPLLHWLAVSFAFALYVVLNVGKYWFFPD